MSQIQCCIHTKDKHPQTRSQWRKPKGRKRYESKPRAVFNFCTATGRHHYLHLYLFLLASGGAQGERNIIPDAICMEVNLWFLFVNDRRVINTWGRQWWRDQPCKLVWVSGCAQWGKAWRLHPDKNANGKVLWIKKGWSHSILNCFKLSFLSWIHLWCDIQEDCVQLELRREVLLNTHTPNWLCVRRLCWLDRKWDTLVYIFLS